MERGDTVLIDYNTSTGLKKLATFTEYADNKYYFFDISGDFALSNDYINRQGIIFETIED